jgi:hypothetical protein
MRKTLFEVEQENFSKVLDCRSSAIAKLATPAGMESLKKYACDCASFMMSEYSDALAKGAGVADRDAVFKRALAEYRAMVPSPLAAIEAEIGALSENIDRMKKALPAFKRWALTGVDDPAGIDVPHPRFDPDAPVINYGGAVIAEKSYMLDDHGRRGEQTFSKFQMPQQQQPQVDPQKNIAAIALLRDRRRGED